ncbi:replication-relaxation family protein [Mariniluteicoccus endophyticus]
MSGRDRLVLARLWEHRFLTTRQLERFVFTGHATETAAARAARRVLARLARDQLIRPLARRIGGVRAGSAATIWQLAPAGARLIQPETGKSWRTYEPSPRFLHHTLAVADAHLMLREGHRHGLEVAVQTEPLSWRRYLGPGGETRLVRPDLAATICGTDQQGRFEDRWFIEVDLGTESMPTLLTKCRAYQAYYQSGTEQTAHGSFPQVLWLLHGPRAAERATALKQRLAHAGRLEARLFAICQPDQLPSLLWNGTPGAGS